MSDFHDVEKYERVLEKIEVKKMLALEKALSGDNPNDIIKATKYVAQREERNDSGERKFNFVDPFVFQNFLGFKDKPIMATYNTLRAMAKSPIPNAIIRTRVNEVGDFTEPQKDIYSKGFVIKKKRLPGMSIEDVTKLSKQEENEVYQITEFLMNGGVNSGWDSVDFEKFVRSITRDSLTFDQYTFEMVYDVKGRPHSFYAVDAATIRISDSIDPEFYEETVHPQSRKPKINGYYPSFVQILDNRIIAEYYPWELCFGVRNPTTDIYANGYGLSEIEEMIAIITSLLWGHEYNKNIFKNGTIPKGFLRIAGNVNANRLSEFRQMWYATMKGVMNSWRTPVLPADKAEWVDLQRNNRDMEYNAWMEFNIKLATALYAIDPAQINFPMRGESGGGGSLFGDSGKYKTEFSKDRGLYPLMRHIQKKINKHIISIINPKYEFYFTGLDAMTPKDELELIEKKVKTYMMIDEIRAEKNLEPLPNGAGQTILDGSMISAATQKEQMKYGFGPAEEGATAGEGEGEYVNADEYDDGDAEKAFDDMLKKNWNFHINNFNKNNKS